MSCVASTAGSPGFHTPETNQTLCFGPCFGKRECWAQSASLLKTGPIEIRRGGTGRQTTLVNFRSCVTSDQNTLTPPNFHNALAIIFLTEWLCGAIDRFVTFGRLLRPHPRMLGVNVCVSTRCFPGLSSGSLYVATATSSFFKNECSSYLSFL